MFYARTFKVCGPEKIALILYNFPIDISKSEVNFDQSTWIFAFIPCRKTKWEFKITLRSLLCLVPFICILLYVSKTSRISLLPASYIEGELRSKMTVISEVIQGTHFQPLLLCFIYKSSLIY